MMSTSLLKLKGPIVDDVLISNKGENKDGFRQENSEENSSEKHFKTSHWVKVPRPILKHLFTMDKAYCLMQKGDLVFSLSEIGAGQEISKLLQQQYCSQKGIYLAISPYSRLASDARYHRELIDEKVFKRYINEERLKNQLATEYEKLPKHPTKRKAIIANTMRTSNFNGHGWIGYKGELELGDEPIAVMMHVRLFHSNTTNQKHETGRLGINLAYAINQADIRSHSETFYDALIAGVCAGQVQIDALYFQGRRLSHLANDSAKKLLKYGLAKRLLVLNNNAISGQSFQNDSLSQIQNELLLPADERLSSLKDKGLYFQVSQWEQSSISMFEDIDIKSACSYLENMKELETPRRRIDIISKIINSANDPIDRKIKEMNTSGFVQGVVAEIGNADFSHMLFSRTFSPIYESTSMPIFEALSSHSLSLLHGIDKKLVETCLEADYKRIQLPKPNKGMSQLLRRFSIFKQVDNSFDNDEVTNVKAWVGIRAEQHPEGQAKNIILQLSAKSSNSTIVNDAIAKVTVNLWYGFFNNASNRSDFAQNLREGIDKNNDALEITIIQNDL